MLKSWKRETERRKREEATEMKGRRERQQTSNPSEPGATASPTGPQPPRHNVPSFIDSVEHTIVVYYTEHSTAILSYPTGQRGQRKMHTQCHDTFPPRAPSICLAKRTIELSMSVSTVKHANVPYTKHGHSPSQILFGTRPYSCIKYRAANRRVCRMERVQHGLKGSLLSICAPRNAHRHKHSP